VGATRGSRSDTGGAGFGTGGAINNNDATLTVTNSTFSANQATGGAHVSEGAEGEGGAIFIGSGAVTITNSTFSSNQAIPGSGGLAFGGGIFNQGDGPVSLKGTILAASTAGNCTGIDDAGYNISDDNSCQFSAMNHSSNNTDPSLSGVLANNGGPTRTIALQTGSPAIDAIPQASCTDQASPPNQVKTDQRGFGRPDPGDILAACDTGAYESGATAPFAGVPGAANCKGKTVSALSQQFGTLDAAAAALGFPSVKALQSAIKTFCAG
jgi:hypothetical protein